MKSLFKRGLHVSLFALILTLAIGHAAHALGGLMTAATLAATQPTLMDLASRLDPNGQTAQIVEVLNQFNEILDDAVAVQANGTTGHKTSIRSGLPAPTWRRLYQGVQPSKSTVVSVTDSFGMLANYSKVDKKLADLNPDGAAAFRATESKPILEGIAQELAQTLFYGNEKTAAAEFTGLAARYNSKSAENGVDNIIDAGGSSTTNCSVWLVVWGDQTAHTIFPMGSKAGVTQTDKGVTTIQNSDGSMFEAYVEYFEVDFGFTLRDWRYVVRIANIDKPTLDTIANTANLVTWMTEATERIPSFSMGRAAFYTNRNIREKLRLGILQKTANQLTWDTVGGKRVMMFDGIPVRRCDQLLNTESQIT